MPHVAAARRRPDLRHAADAGARRTQAARARPRRRAPPDSGPAARSRDRRAVRDRVHPRHAQHARLRGAGHPHAGRHRSSTPATSRSTRRRSTASTSTCTGSPSSARPACWRSSPTARTSIAAASPARRSRSSTRSRRSSPARRGRIIVAAFASSIYRMQILVDLAAQFDRKVAFVGRGMIENSQIAQRLGYLRIPPGMQIRDSDVRNVSGAGRARASAPDRRASRCRRCRASPSTITATSSSPPTTPSCCRRARFRATRRRSAA